MGKKNMKSDEKRVEKNRYKRYLEKKNKLVFNKQNYRMFYLALFTIFVGYVVMYLAHGSNAVSMVIAPIILFIGYVIILPYSILYYKKNEDK